MAHMDRTSMYDIRGVHISICYDFNRARAPGLVLSHRVNVAHTGVWT